MKKLILVTLTVLAFAACKNSQPSPSPAPNPAPAPQPQPNPEPSSHKQPVAVDPSGLKQGTCVLKSSSGPVWTVENTTVSPAPTKACSGSESAGQACNQGDGCVEPDKSYMVCEGAKQVYTCYGWVYEQDQVAGGTSFKPLANVGVDVFWFAGCIVGSCKPVAGPVTTDQWGYFELDTTSLLDTLRLHDPAGYYGVCKNGAPMDGGGQALYGQPNKAMLVMSLKPILPTSCK